MKQFFHAFIYPGGPLSPVGCSVGHAAVAAAGHDVGLRFLTSLSGDFSLLMFCVCCVFTFCILTFITKKGIHIAAETVYKEYTMRMNRAFLCWYVNTISAEQ